MENSPSLANATRVGLLPPFCLELLAAACFIDGTRISKDRLQFLQENCVPLSYQKTTILWQLRVTTLQFREVSEKIRAALEERPLHVQGCCVAPHGLTSKLHRLSCDTNPDNPLHEHAPCTCKLCQVANDKPPASSHRWVFLVSFQTATRNRIRGKKTIISA